MESNLDFGRQKSINEILQRGEEERKRALDTIDFLLNHKVEVIFSNGKSVFYNLKQLAEKLGIEFDEENDLENLKIMIITGLTNIKMNLEQNPLTEENVLTDTRVGESQELLDTISAQLDSLSDNIWKACYGDFIKKLEEKKQEENRVKKLAEERKEIESKIAGLEKKEMYYKGMLAVIKLPNKKKEVEEKLALLKTEKDDLNKQSMDLLMEMTFPEKKEDTNNEQINEKKEITENIEPKEEDIINKEDETIEF